MNRFKQLIAEAGLALRDHQVAALRWGLIRERGGAVAGHKVVRGGILADEMASAKPSRCWASCTPIPSPVR